MDLGKLQSRALFRRNLLGALAGASAGISAFIVGAHWKGVLISAGWTAIAVWYVLGKFPRQRYIEPILYGKKLKPGDRLYLSGGYAMNPEWLGSNQGYSASVINYLPTNGPDPNLLIQFDHPIITSEFKSDLAVLQLRWEEDSWLEAGVVHVNLLDAASPIDQQQGVHVESHASYSLV